MNRLLTITVLAAPALLAPAHAADPQPVTIAPTGDSDLDSPLQESAKLCSASTIRRR